MSIELVDVQLQEKPILENMLHFYLNDLSKYTRQLSTNREGIFEYKRLDEFFIKPNLAPYFITHNKHIIGFILLVKSTNNNRHFDFCINDLFVLRQYRRQGLAKKAIHYLLCQNPGYYHVLQLEKNLPAVHFWKSLYNEFDIKYGEDVMMDSGERCLSQTFIFEKYVSITQK